MLVRRQVLSLCVVVAALVAAPFGLRAVNRLLPGAEVRESYVPTMETPRPREPFDEAAAATLREAQPEFVIIGDSMAGIRINPGHLSRVTGRSVAGLFHPGSPVAYWYLEFKNFVVENQLRNVRGAMFFFRDDQLTRQVVVNTSMLDRVARDREPELDRVMAAHRLGRFSGVHRAARAAYQFDRTRVWLEPLLIRAPAHLAAPEGKAPADLVEETNAEIFALERLRRFEAADLAAADDAALAFDEQVDTSLLPALFDLAERANIRLGFIAVQRRPRPDGPPERSQALRQYLDDLRAYIERRGGYFHDDWGAPGQPLEAYADGDHLHSRERDPYTERFARAHAAFFQ